MLFGRKKPGFVQIEEADGTTAKDEHVPETGEEKPELMAYLKTLPEVDDIYADVVTEDEEAEAAPLTEAQKLAGYIRTRSAAAQLTSEDSLREEIEDFDELIKEVIKDESLGDIRQVKGNKGVYFYSSESMSDNYAMIASLVEEKDLPATISQMVRFNCKTYPAPTPIVYFERHPYFATAAQLERALDVISSRQEYVDIKVFKNSSGVQYLYSEELMSERYAKSLAEDEKYTD